MPGHSICVNEISIRSLHRHCPNWSYLTRALMQQSLFFRAAAQKESHTYPCFYMHFE